MPNRIQLSLSPVSIGLWCFLQGALVILVSLRSLDEPYWLLLTPVCFWLAIRHWRHDADNALWLQPVLSKEAPGHSNQITIWQIGFRDRETQSADLIQAFAHPWLTVLKFKAPGWQYSLVLWPGSAEADSLRRLRYHCIIPSSAAQK